MPSIACTALAATAIAAAPTNPYPAAAIAEAARLLLPDLQCGRRIDASMLRAAIERASGGSDTEGAWDWKTAYDACEVATVVFLRKFGPAMLGRAASPAAMLPMLAKIAVLLPTHTRRSEESQARFSNSRRRLRSVSLLAPPPRSHRRTWCWNPRQGPACSQSSPSLLAAR